MSQSKKDILYLCALWLFPVWLLLLELSQCEWVDSPFAFVHGCNNYGIDWNKIIAPLGIIGPFMFAVSILYFFIRFCGLIKNKISNWKNANNS